MTEIISLEEEYDRAFTRAKEVLSSGGVLIYPTDTVYGIGGDARREEVVARIRGIKGKKEGEPFSILLGGLGMVKEYAHLEGKALGAVMEGFPGAVTFILKAKKPLPVIKGGKIGVRVPEHIFMRRLSLELNMPIVTTSANRGGEKAPVGFSGINKEILEKVDLALDGGETMHRMASTIIDLESGEVKRVGVGEINF